MLSVGRRVAGQGRQRDERDPSGGSDAANKGQPLPSPPLFGNEITHTTPDHRERFCACIRVRIGVCKARYIQDFGCGYYTGARVRVEFVRGDRGTSREGPNIESCWLGSETVFN